MEKRERPYATATVAQVRAARDAVEDLIAVPDIDLYMSRDASEAIEEVQSELTGVIRDMLSQDKGRQEGVEVQLREALRKLAQVEVPWVVGEDVFKVVRRVFELITCYEPDAAASPV